jgi:hypothetical protein
MLPRLWSSCEGRQQGKITENSFEKISHHFLTRFYRGIAASLIGLALNSMQPAAALPQTFSASPTAEASRADDAGMEARIQVLTRPIGALVFLDGEYSMTGRTPYTVTYFLKGRYRIRATKLGYEDWKKDYVFNGQGVDKLSIKLTPKTRYKAFLRSMLVPGLGQAYSDHKTRGLVIGVMQFSAAGVLIYRNFKYTDALNEYNAALKNFQAGQKTQEGQAELVAQLLARKAVLDEAYEIRKRWLVITGLIYAYNVLEALIFFPSYQQGNVNVSVSLAQNPERYGAAVGLKVKAKF